MRIGSWEGEFSKNWTRIGTRNLEEEAPLALRAETGVWPFLVSQRDSGDEPVAKRRAAAATGRTANVGIRPGWGGGRDVTSPRAISLCQVRPDASRDLRWDSIGGRGSSAPARGAGQPTCLDRRLLPLSRVCRQLSSFSPPGWRLPAASQKWPNSTLWRFMESTLFENDLLTDLEPGIPGGETPPSTAGGTPAATEVRFMESCHELRLGDEVQELGRQDGSEHRGLQSRRDCGPKPGVARNELPRGWSGFSTNPNGVAPARRNPVGVVNSRNLPPGVGPRCGPTPGSGTESRWDSWEELR